MRVAIVVPAFLPARGYGGPIAKILRLAPAVRARGIDIEVITSTLTAPGETGLASGETVVAELPILRLPTPAAWRWAPWVQWQTPPRPVDLFHVIGTWNGLSYAALNAAARTATAVLWEPAGMFAVGGRHRHLKQLLTPLHVRWAHRVTAMIWTSPQERAEAPPALRAVPHWWRPNPAPTRDGDHRADIHAARRALDLPLDGPLWGYLGRIDDRKGLDRMVAAWDAAGGPGRLVVAGPIGDQALARRLRHLRVRLLGELDADARWDYLRALDALVLVPTFGENFGNVVVEALRVGTPVVASPAVGAANWIDRNHGVTVVDWPGLRDRFAAGDIPSETPRIPASLEPEHVGRRQAEIYTAAVQRHGAGR